MPLTKIELGREAEELAANYIHSKGYQIITKNWQYKGRGEIDIIARDDETLVFVEVRYRGEGSWGTPQDSVDGKKLRNLQNAAKLYIKTELDNEYPPMRIDLVGVSFSSKISKGANIEHFKNIGIW